MQCWRLIQSGFGSRMKETGQFYDRFPHWSQMGQLVTDASAAVDALSKDSLVDPNHVYLFGYSLGGTVAIYTAALDSDVCGIVSICGFTPMRTDAAARGDGGIARYAIERPLIPRAWFFHRARSADSVRLCRSAWRHCAAAGAGCAAAT